MATEVVALGALRRGSAVLLAVGLAVIGLAVVTATPAHAADASITSAGPLTNITISDELNCAVNHTGDTAGEFYGDTACATEIAVGGQIYGPSNIPAGNSPGGYTPVSQTGPTGSGTSGDPYKIVTVVDVGTTGLRITETDSYVVGEEAYRTDVVVTNTTNTAKSAIVYRGGDCYLQNSDTGFGAVGNPPGAIACVAEDLNNPGQPGTRIEQWLPLTGGSHYYEAYYGDVWDAMDAQTDFPDTCACNDNIDNGAGLSWSINLAASASTTLSHLTTFSPAGLLPLTTSKTADASTAVAGAQDGYTITVSNPNAQTVQLSSISDTLPAGFAYVSGSSSGATTSNPSIAASTLTWSGSFNVPAAANNTPGTLTLHFNVTVSNTPGTYYNNATAAATGYTVAPTGATAPITVTPAPTTTTTSTTTTSTSTTTTSTTSTTSTTIPPTTTTSTTAPPATTTTTQCATRPGYGYGDRNHCHTGPPGRANPTRLAAATHGPQGWLLLTGAGLVLVGLLGEFVIPRRRRQS